MENLLFDNQLVTYSDDSNVVQAEGTIEDPKQIPKKYKKKHFDFVKKDRNESKFSLTL